MAEKFGLQGVDAVMARLKNLKQEINLKGTRAAGTKAMRIVRDSARKKAKTLDDPKSAADISKNIVTRYNKKASKRERGVVVQVGVQGGARPRKGREDTGHFRYLEFGSVHNRATPFLRPALANNVGAVTDAFVKALDPAIDKALSKVKK